MKYILTILLLLNTTITLAQQNSNTYERLEFIQKKVGNLYYQINQLEEKIKQGHSRGNRVLEGELGKYKDELALARTQFYSVASGIDYSKSKEAQERPQKKLFDQLQELLSPLLDSIQRLSEKPRMVQKLTKDKNLIIQEIETIRSGIENLKQTIKDNKNPKLELLLKQANDHLENTKEELIIKQQSINQSLENILSQKISVWDKIMRVIRGFLGTKGRNLFLSLAVFTLCMWLSFFVKKRLFLLPIFRRQLYFLNRPLRALYGVLGTIFSSLAALACLYLLNDWVLVTIVILLITSILWSLKQYAPRFVEEIRLIFNLGTVREGQRIIWKGVPWRVKRLGLYSTLINDELQNTPVKVAASELIKEHSRPMVDNEPWFPSSVNDWVLLNDGTYGQVIIQSPEMVVIQLLGNSKKYYSTSDYLAQTPHNLSEGFRFEVVFGLDYQHQSLICNEVLSIVDKRIKEKLAHRLGENNPDFIKLTIDFHSAGESSLNLWIKADCAGQVANDRPTISREIHKAMVEICNENNYVIPFNQLTVHMAK